MRAVAPDRQLYYDENRKLVDRLLDSYLPSATDEPKVLHEAMRYSVMASGKRLRPILALAAYEYCSKRRNSDTEKIHYAMAALEMVHTYSLIHDDLPCMDDDDLRRGMPSCHKKFGEAVAILAGDALHDIAFGLLALTGSTAAVMEMATALGTKGMIGGQVADVAAEGREVSREEIIDIHKRKTGALIRCSVGIGAILASADSALKQKLTSYGEKVGLAFQIIDDILDVEGDQELLGKTVGSDSSKQKATYPKAVGIEQSHLDAAELITNAVELFDPDDENMLKHIAIYIGQRRR